MGRKRKTPGFAPATDFAYAFHLSPAGKVSHDWTVGAFTRITGHPADFLEERGWESLTYPKDKPLLKERPAVLLSGRADVREYRVITADGRLKWIRDYAEPIHTDPDGSVLVFAAAQDITARKRAENE